MGSISRASDNSREKKNKFRGIFGDKFAEKTADFAGISREFSGQISRKYKEESQKERFQKKKKDILEGCQIQGKEENTKVHPTQFSRQLYFFRATRKTQALQITETPGRLTSFFSSNLEPNTATQ